MLKYIEIRQKFLGFLKSKNHVEIPNSPLVPENDPTVLFVNAGMFPLVPFLIGEKHPLGKRLCNIQRSVRTGDIEEVGDSSHCTAFEMLGYWSLNDYFKKEAINTTLEFFINVLKLDPNKIYGSVFGGEGTIPRDDESINYWVEALKRWNISAKVGKRDKIQAFGINKTNKKEWQYDEKSNMWISNKENKCWWGLDAGGPCGPSSEFFYDTGKEFCGEDCNINCNCGKFLEIGNDVLMQFNKVNGKLEPLGRHNVDFGGGLERIATIIQNVESYYETDIYLPILNKVKEISKEQIVFSQRLIVDHIKSATWIVMDGVTPGRSEQGYILRRLIRRSVRHAKKLGINELFTRQISEVSIEQFKEIYPELTNKKDEIIRIIKEEEIKFNKTLKDGLKEVEKVIKVSGNEFSNDNGVSFKLYETYGFPPEMFLEELKNRNIYVDEIVFWKNHNKALEEHQEKSRTAAKGFFKGGLADTSDISKRYHTAQHLLLASMRKIVGENIYQKGSNITPDRLRFDFPSEEKLSLEQIKQIEDMVNEIIDKSLEVNFYEEKKEIALKKVPFAMFEERYGDTVKIYHVGPKDNPFSQEICNGPHVNNTSEIGKFKIIKQENLGAGVKRIKAVIE